MFSAFTHMMNRHLLAAMFDSTCEIHRPEGDGTWTPLGEFACNVQADILSPSSEDSRTANADDMKQVSMFVSPETPVQVGNRVLWGERVWSIGADTHERSTQSLVRVVLTDWQTAVEPEEISFWRMSSGSRVPVATLQVHTVVSAYVDAGSEARSTYRGDTARGVAETGVLIAGPDAQVLQVGDWFTRNGKPGRVTAVDTVDPERVKVSVSVERGAL